MWIREKYGRYPMAKKESVWYLTDKTRGGRSEEMEATCN